MLTSSKIRTHLARNESEQHEKDASASEKDDETFCESPAAMAERARQFATIKELLTAPELRTS